MARNIIGEISSCVQKYKWIIDYQCIIGKQVGDVLKSPVFKTVNNSCHWQIELYPNGYTENYKDHFSIYLILLSNDELNITLSFEIVNNEGKVVVKDTTYGLINTALNSWGIHKFVKPKMIENDHTEGNGKLTIICEIMMNENEEQKDDSEHQHLIADFEQLMHDKEFSDVEFTIGNEELWAHKSILSCRSPVFAGMFRNEMIEKHEKKVEITDIRHEVFQEMLRYVYAEKVNDIERIAGELLVAADKYSLDGLKLMCEKSLSANLNADNVLDILQLADRHSTEGLRAKCIEFIVTKAGYIVDEPEFRQLPVSVICDVCSAALADKNT